MIDEFLQFDAESRETIKKFNKLPNQIRSAGRKATDNGILILHREIENKIMEEGVVASGDYLESLDLSFRDVNDYYSASVGSTLDYAESIEYGRLPGNAPPVPAILEWMSSVGKEATLFGAMMIASSIGEKGYAGKHIFEKAFDSGTNKAVDEFELEMRIAIQE